MPLNRFDPESLKRLYPTILATVGEPWAMKQAGLLNIALGKCSFRRLPDIYDCVRSHPGELGKLSTDIFGLMAERESPEGMPLARWIDLLEDTLKDIAAACGEKLLASYRSDLRDPVQFFPVVAELVVVRLLLKVADLIDVHVATDAAEPKGLNHDLKMRIRDGGTLLRGDVKFHREGIYSIPAVELPAKLGKLVKLPAACILSLREDTFVSDDSIIALAEEIDMLATEAVEALKKSDSAELETANASVVRGDNRVTIRPHGGAIFAIDFPDMNVKGGVLSVVTSGAAPSPWGQGAPESGAMADLLDKAARQLAGPDAPTSLNICFIGAHNDGAAEDARYAALEDPLSGGRFTDGVSVGSFRHMAAVVFFSMTVDEGGGRLKVTVKPVRFDNPNSRVSWPAKTVDQVTAALDASWSSDGGWN